MALSKYNRPDLGASIGPGGGPGTHSIRMCECALAEFVMKKNAPPLARAFSLLAFAESASRYAGRLKKSKNRLSEDVERLAEICIGQIPPLLK